MIRRCEMYKEMYSCAGKVAVVFGGLGLIGRQISVALAEFGAKVCTVDRGNNNDLRVDHCHHYCCDVTQEDSLRNVLDEVIREHGSIDVLVNCAYPRTSDWGAKFEGIKLSSWQENVATQLGSTFLSCQIVAEQMKLRKKGSIINIGSTYGIVGPDFRVYEGTEMTMPAAYSAIKGGVINFTRYLASYYGQHGVRVNCVSPGGIFNHQPASFVERYESRTPLGRMGRSHEIASAAVFLASEASSYVTGHNLVVDGGWTAW